MPHTRHKQNNINKKSGEDEKLIACQELLSLFKDFLGCLVIVMVCNFFVVGLSLNMLFKVFSGFLESAQSVRDHHTALLEDLFLLSNGVWIFALGNHFLQFCCLVNTFLFVQLHIFYQSGLWHS
eukprot:c8418_g1_i2.p2 GENE.c8418_g1_i2~~c8418_g1_i2.p2  ORF type:complete len:124 (+),score=4.55 c8418_g1_i2:121-492(+)